MKNNSDELLKQVLDLPLDDRTALIKRVLHSIQESPDQAIDRAWAAEVERRIDAYERGETETFSLEEVVADLRSQLGT